MSGFSVFLQGLGTITCMIAFIGVVWWAFRRKNRQRFEDAAQLPFVDEADQPSSKNRHVVKGSTNE